MNPCFREKFLKNGVVFSKEEFEIQNKEKFCIYEVVRVIEGKVLFFEDHLERFRNSLKIANIQFNIDLVKKDVKALLEVNNYKDGNIRIELFVSENNKDLISYYIEHHYPSDVDYLNGVRLKSLVAERSNPNAKIVHKDLKEKVNEILRDKNIYEVLLITNEGIITEGSRSNIFFIKDKNVFTAPENMVLSGITRKYVFEAIRRSGLNVFEEKINYKNVINFQSSFVTGTSPKVLPVNQIDNFFFEPQSSVLNSILKSYDEIIYEYLCRHKF